MLFTFPNFLGGVDSSFVPLQCFLWYSQCLLFQKSFHLDTRRRKRKNVLLMLLAMMRLWRRNQTIMSTRTKKFLLWDLERISEVKYVFWINICPVFPISVTQTGPRPMLPTAVTGLRRDKLRVSIGKLLKKFDRVVLCLLNLVEMIKNWAYI